MEIINIKSRSISIMLKNDFCYYNKDFFAVYLNDKFLFNTNLNVFTIFNLEPDKDYSLKILNKEIKFKTLKEDYTFNLNDFHVLGNGLIDETAKIQAAINLAPKNTTIIIDKGTYLVSSLFLKSNINIYLKKDAKIISILDRNSYPVLPGLISNINYGIWEGSHDNNFASVFNIIDSENVTIYGEGIINSNAQDGDWYINHRIKNIAWRGHAIFTERSKNIDIIGLNIKNTFSWAIHPFLSNNINLINLKIENKDSMPTTDGIDPDMCDNVHIYGNIIDVGDDCIAIKSGTYELAKKINKPSSNIIISNNLMLKGHGGVVIGSEISGGLNNLLVEKCLFKNTDRGLRIKTRRGRGRINPIDNIKFNNIIMDGVLTPFVINMYYNMGPKGGHEEYVWTKSPQEFNDLTPVIGHFEFSNMKCLNVGYAAGVFLGLSESKIEGITLNNVSFKYNKDIKEGSPVMIEHPLMMKNKGIYALNVKNVILNNVTFEGLDGKEIIKEES